MRLTLCIALTVIFATGVNQTLTAQSPARTTVYVTKTGEKYHKSTCHHLINSKIKKTLEEAKRLGYDPCKVCKPKGYVHASGSSAKATSTSVRCSGLTKVGSRCKRMTRNSSGRCYQHQ